MFSKLCNFLQMVFGSEQKEENNNVTRNSSRSDILSISKFLFSIFIHQNTQSTTYLNIYSILKELP